MRTLSFFLSIILVWLLVEAGFGIWHHRQHHFSLFPPTIQVKYERGSGEHTVFDPVLGYKPSPRSTATVTTTAWDGKEINRARYTTDEFSRRTHSSTETLPDRAVLFFGCSFTFGSGVNDDETLPSQYQEATSVRSYNYGYFGYGPQQMLAKLESQTLPGEVGERKVDAVYTFIDDHLKRMTGTLRVVNSRREHGMDMPRYELAGDGLRRMGNFLDQSTIQRFLFAALGKSHVLWHLNVDFPRVDSPENLALWDRMMVVSKEMFEKQFPAGRFRVLFFPGSKFAEILAPRLRESGIELVDYSQWYDWNERDMWIPQYQHPSAKAYQRVAHALKRHRSQPLISLK